MTLEFDLPPQDAARLWRNPTLQARRTGPPRAAAIHHIWHDTPDGALASQGLSLCEIRGKTGLWRLERLHPTAALGWLPATCPPVLAVASHPDAFNLALKDELAPAAACTGKCRTLTLALDTASAKLCLLEGALRGVTQDHPACRLSLTGHPADIAAFALELAETLPIRVPPTSLAASSLCLTRGTQAAPKPPGPPSLAPGATVSDALTAIAAQLAETILLWSDKVAQADTPHPVHQMRVAVRRLRSAVSVFRRAAASHAAPADWLYELAAALRDLAARLGAARDWDVFLQTTGPAVQAAFPDDRRIALLLAAAARKQQAAYAELGTYLAGQDWRLLSLRLALLPTLRPWDRSGPGEILVAPIRLYAAEALGRRLKPLLAVGANLSGLPPERLHDIRKQAKRLRYATEFFAPLFAGKAVAKYLPKLEHLQEVLGAVNDAAVAKSLTSQLAGGADRAFAAGVVQGFGAAKARRSTAKAQHAWTRFTRASPFWV